MVHLPSLGCDPHHLLSFIKLLKVSVQAYDYQSAKLGGAVNSNDVKSSNLGLTDFRCQNYALCGDS
jgi:hypothetical protein